LTSILGISGSLRADSLHTELLRLAAEELPESFRLEVWEGLREIPPYDADDEDDIPTAVRELVEALEGVDAVVFSSPEYNGSVPGQLKNAIDWASRKAIGLPLQGKPALVIGGSPGQFGAIWGHADLRKVLGIAGARVVDAELSVPRLHERLSEPDDELRADVRAALDALASALPAVV
jgi:chromate reductase